MKMYCPLVEVGTLTVYHSYYVLFSIISNIKLSHFIKKMPFKCRKTEKKMQYI